MKQLRPNIFGVGAIDWDRRLFDELIPLPDGTSYNAYLVKGSEKIALLDTVDPTKSVVLIDNLLKLGIDRLDYVVAHHGEQDHSGSLPDILSLYPGAKVVANPKCQDMLIHLLHLDADRFVIVDDGQEISLGDKSLRFIYVPWVHWPETFATYLKEDSILFSCDFFGSHLATSSLFVDDRPRVYEAAKRYYAEIMMPFRTTIRKNLQKLADFDIKMIAPSHGPVYDDPGFIVDAYKDWTSERVANEVVVAYVSMHDSTRAMVEHLVDALIDRNITVRRFNLTGADIGELAVSLVDAATIVLASPTVLTGPHPAVGYAAMLANALRPKTRFAAVVGSYGWAGKMVDQLKALISNLKVEVLEPVIAKGYPDSDDFARLDALAQAVLTKHKELGIVQ